MDDRLQRLLTEELGACSEDDLAERVDDLEAMAASVPADTAGDVTALSALGDDTRYRLARLLATAERECCVCELTSLVDVSDSAVSHALADLVDAGLAERRKEGRWRYYRATERTEALVAALDATRVNGEEGEVTA